MKLKQRAKAAVTKAEVAAESTEDAACVDPKLAEFIKEVSRTFASVSKASKPVVVVFRVVKCILSGMRL